MQNREIVTTLQYYGVNVYTPRDNIGTLNKNNFFENTYCF